MYVLTWYGNYAGAEETADRYKGDTGTDEPVRVVEDFVTGKFLVVIGEVDVVAMNDDDDRYEIQYEA